MRSTRRSDIFSIIAGLLFALPVSAADLTDATGVAISATSTPRRIVTLAPSVAELAADFLGGDFNTIVGVSEYTDFPKALSGKPSIGPYAAFNIERVIALKPDLVLATFDGNPSDRVLRLRAMGFRVVVVATQGLSDVETALKTVAAALGRSADGVAAAGVFHEKLAAIRNASTGRAVRRVLLQIGEEPLVVAGRKSFLNAALEAVGARNIYGDLKQAYPRPSLEDVLSRNPDDIVVVSMGSAESAAHMAGEWKKLPNLSAVKSAKIHVISGDLLLRPSPRLIDGLKALESSLYGS